MDVFLGNIDCERIVNGIARSPEGGGAVAKRVENGTMWCVGVGMMRSKNDNDDGVESTGGREEEIEPPVTEIINC